MEKDLTYLAKMIDHSLLHPSLTDDAVVAGCELANHYNVASVCVKPYAVQLASDLLAGTSVTVSTVVGFPYGSDKMSVKVLEAEEACADGATEVDFVVNVGKVLSQDWDYVTFEVGLINAAVTACGALAKVTFENDYYDDDRDIVRLCEICADHGVAFVKTSTGYEFVRPANGVGVYRYRGDRHLRLMRAACPPHIQIKAAADVHTLDDLLRVRALGVTRVEATSTERILTEARVRGYRENGVYQIG